MHTDTVQLQIEINKEDIAYIVGIFEAYDHLAVVRTVDNTRCVLGLMIAPDFLDDTHRLLDSLASEIPLKIISE